MPRSAPALRPRVARISIHGRPAREGSVYYYRKSFLTVLAARLGARARARRNTDRRPSRSRNVRLFSLATSSRRVRARTRMSNFNSRVFPLARAVLPFSVLRLSSSTANDRGRNTDPVSARTCSRNPAKFVPRRLGADESPRAEIIWLPLLSPPGCRADGGECVSLL